MAVLVSFGIIGLCLLGLAWLARSDHRRIAAVGLSALEEELRPRAAEHQKIDEHAAGVDDEGDRGPPR